MITLTGVTKVYKSSKAEVTALNDVNLHVEEGEIFGMIGYSGAGKSTLIRLLNGLETPSTGTVEVAGNRIDRLTGNKLRNARQGIGMIFQHFNLLWSRTVKENISFPLEVAGVSPADRFERIRELMKLVGLEGKEHAYPSQLSGGQKQRVGIARALAANPKVLLCDEATSALDPQTTDSILDLLVDINRKWGITIVLITHEMHVIRKICHRVAVMDSGSIVEQGDVLQVFKRPQQAVTKQFVKQVAETEETFGMIEHISDRYPNGKVLRLAFYGEAAEQPVITHVIRHASVTINILQGKLSQTQKGAYGTLFVYIEGDKNEVEKAISYIRDRQVDVEVITHD
ncbi:methionine ABC transporter ATP-binding protein [Paenibacillus sp. MBLB4367]|uniref:methionine ABC transporter ATP-binding protein n=1 Tax=Paenibacillus sp. MBLB4367 TaxID=3384767 RepID=UPI00390812D2